MASFQIMSTHLPTLQHKDRRWHRNAASKQVFRHHEHEVPRRERRRQRGTSAPLLSVSTKGVHGMWIIMWMSNQNHALPQHLTHCPIDRQHNPNNFSKMHFLAETRVEQKGGDSAHPGRFFMIGHTEVCGVTVPSSRETRTKGGTSEIGVRLRSEIRGLRNFESRLLH